MTTLADIKTTLTDTDANTVLEDLIQRITDTVERELDWYFRDPRPVLEVLDGTGTRALWLRQPPVDGVAVYSRIGVGEVWELVDAEDYEQTGRAIFHVSNWTPGTRNYQIAYQEGFTEMPGDIYQLILDLVVLNWNRRGQDPGIKSERIGDYAYTLGDLEESKYWKAVVMRWRRGRI